MREFEENKSYPEQNQAGKQLEELGAEWEIDFSKKTKAEAMAKGKK